MNWFTRLLLKLGILKTGFHDKCPIRGRTHIELRDGDGNLKDERFLMNTITELCDAHVADQMSDSGDSAIGYMAVGTGTGQGSGDVGLATQNDINALTSTTQGSSGADNDVVYVGDWAAGDATAAITEAGIFLTSDNTSMMTVSSFSVINKGAIDTLKITWTLTFGAS